MLYVKRNHKSKSNRPSKNPSKPYNWQSPCIKLILLLFYQLFQTCHAKSCYESCKHYSKDHKQNKNIRNLTSWIAKSSKSEIWENKCLCPIAKQIKSIVYHNSAFRSKIIPSIVPRNDSTDKDCDDSWDWKHFCYKIPASSNVKLKGDFFAWVVF